MVCIYFNVGEVTLFGYKSRADCVACDVGTRITDNNHYIQTGSEKQQLARGFQTMGRDYYESEQYV